MERYITSTLLASRHFITHQSKSGSESRLILSERGSSSFFPRKNGCRKNDIIVDCPDLIDPLFSHSRTSQSHFNPTFPPYRKKIGFQVFILAEYIDRHIHNDMHACTHIGTHRKFSRSLSLQARSYRYFLA